MTFLEDVKNQIIGMTTKSVCCRRAMLSGVFFAKARLVEDKITLNLSDKSAIDFTARLILEFYGKEATLGKNSLGGIGDTLSFFAPSAEKYIRSLSSRGEAFIKKCDGCTAAFLRGVFLAAGRIVDPKKQFRLEVSVGERYKQLLELLSNLGTSFSYVKRGKEDILYLQKSSEIEDFFGLLGLNNTVFYLMNLNFENELKNSVNRIRNCETSNISKSVFAAAKSISAITALDEANLLSTLPDELLTTARLRMQYKDYSLSRLAAEFSPPLSKPGLSHRLNKIIEIAENYFGKE